MRTCPLMRAALAPTLLVGVSDTGRAYVRKSVDFGTKYPAELLDELSACFGAKYPAEVLDELSACSTSCQHYSTCIPTGEGYASGCTLAALEHFRA